MERQKMLDEITKMKYSMQLPEPPVITLISFEEPEDTEDAISHLCYPNIRVEYVRKSVHTIEHTLQLILDIDTKYFCFFTKNIKWNPYILYEFVLYMDSRDEVDSTICFCNTITQQGETISLHDRGLNDLFANNEIYDGAVLLETSLKKNINIYGNLSSCIIRRESFLIKNFLASQIVCPVGQELTFLLFECLYGMRVSGIEKALVSVVARKWNKKQFKQEQENFKKLVCEMRRKEIISSDMDFVQGNVYEQMLNAKCNFVVSNSHNQLKSITLFHTDKGEFYNLEPIAKEAEKRGYTVKFSTDIREKAEIGIYCQHICYPENSMFSVILLHDMAQGHNRWPDIWNIERWNGFDVGIVPGREWTERWERCALNRYARPRIGVFELGYPKGDNAMNPILKEEAKVLREKLGLKYEKTVLYAPSWENDEKQDELVQALKGLEINVLVKQAHWPDQYKDIVQNIKEMREKHEGKVENVFIVEPKENIMVALELCDIVVSDESSVMTEALLFDKPSIAVVDWKIPDTIPSRYACVPFDYVYKCEKKELRSMVEAVLEKPEEVIEKLNGVGFFSNRGNCNKGIIDLIEYCLGYSKEKSVLEYMQKPIYMPRMLGQE